MTLASATRMMCHPLLTQSNKQRFDRGHVRISDVSFSGEGKALTVRGKVESNIEPFAVIAYSDAEGGSNYDAYQWTREVQPDGTFEITLDQHQPGKNALRLNFCHANGATSEASYAFTANEIGEPNIAALQESLVVRDIEQSLLSGDFAKARELAKNYLAANPKTEIADYLRHCKSYEGNPPPIALADLEGSGVYLSDVQAEREQVGYGRPSRNVYFHTPRGSEGGFFLMPGGKFHAKGLYAHTPSNYTYDLDGKWKRFHAFGGLQKGASEDARVVFIVLGDGKELHRSAKLATGDLAIINVRVHGVKKLELIAETGGENNRSCWAVWGSPRISR